MKLQKIDTTGCANAACPTIYRTDRGTYVVQGTVVPPTECSGDITIAANEALIEVPEELIERLRK